MSGRGKGKASGTKSVSRSSKAGLQVKDFRPSDATMSLCYKICYHLISPDRESYQNQQKFKNQKHQTRIQTPLSFLLRS